MYDAFISYSQKADKQIARAIRSVIQNIGKPWWALRSLNVYLDSSSLSANQDLWGTIEKALEESRYLILLASPEAAESPWVDQEVSWWLKHKCTETLLLVVTDGALKWSTAAEDFIWNEATPLPPPLKARFTTEPLWVALDGYRAAPQTATKRNQDFLDRVLILAATIHGRKKEDLYSDELREQRRNLRWAYGAAGALLIAAIAAGTAGAIAWVQRNQAITARNGAFISQSRFLADRSEQHASSGDHVNGILIALDALPDAADGRDRPYVAEAETSLLSAVLGQRELSIVGTGGGKVLDVSIDSSTGRVATAHENGNLRLWDLTSGASLKVLTGHSGPIRKALFRPDGKQMVTASDDGTARLWDVSGAQPTSMVLQGDGSPFQLAKYSPDAKWVVTGDRTGELLVWDPETGNRIATLPGHRGSISSIEFDWVRQRLITASEDHTARLWRLGEWTPIMTLEGHTEKVENAVLSPNGRWIVTASSDGSVAVWNAEDGSREFGLGTLPDFVYRAEFSPDSARILVVSNDGLGRVYDVASRQIVFTLRGHDQLVQFGTFSPDGQFIATISRDGTARLWSASDGSVVAVLRGHLDFVSSLAIDLRAGRLVTGSWDGTARIWALRASKATVLAAHGDRVYSAAYNPDGTKFVTASEDGSAAIWDSKSLTKEATLGANGSRATHAAFSRDGKYIITTGDTREAIIWDASSRQPSKRLTGHADVVVRAIFSSDSRYVATASRDRTARIWDVASAQTIATLAVGEGTVNSVLFSPDGLKVVTGDGNNTATIWDWRSRAALHRIRGNGNAVYPLAIDPDGKLLAFSSWSLGRNIIWVYDFNAGNLITSFDGHSEFIWSLAFDRTGKKLVSAAKDGKAVIWDVIRFVEIGRLFPHSGWVYSAEFNPTGTTVLTADEKGNVRLWPISQTLDQLVEVAKAAVPRCLTGAQRRDIEYIETASPAWCSSKWPMASIPQRAQQP